MVGMKWNWIKAGHTYTNGRGGERTVLRFTHNNKYLPGSQTCVVFKIVKSVLPYEVGKVKTMTLRSFVSWAIKDVNAPEAEIYKK